MEVEKDYGNRLYAAKLISNESEENFLYTTHRLRYVRDITNLKYAYTRGCTLKTKLKKKIRKELYLLKFCQRRRFYNNHLIKYK